ncbi:hypothetical protein AM501_25670 [Aneurinibacillus migulanus]|uniref:hypothetical protein n=1 Tax=Aneurinibacillus migulanus TaxID=47500 RepID=UPI0006B57998|nr:hypothetical protein [Aneurinibacillus migulanus]KPD05544.1 hypothetical protein AM501_25670 [Aneurinibacillus migulanus]
MLLTGPQKLTMWQKLYDEQQDYLEQLKQEMVVQGIKEYECYRGYQSELHLLSLYKNTILKIERFINERKLKYGESYTVTFHRVPKRYQNWVEYYVLLCNRVIPASLSPSANSPFTYH